MATEILSMNCSLDQNRQTAESFAKSTESTECIEISIPTFQSYRLRSLLFDGSRIPFRREVSVLLGRPSGENELVDGVRGLEIAEALP